MPTRDPDGGPADATDPERRPRDRGDRRRCHDRRRRPPPADQVETTEPRPSNPPRPRTPEPRPPPPSRRRRRSCPGRGRRAGPAAAPPPSKPNKFLADLTKAMQATAEAARAETMERFAAEAKAATERVHADAAEEITELRRVADDDVAGDPRLVEGRDRPHPRGDRDAHRRAARPTSRASSRSTPASIERRVERVSAARRRLRGRDGRVLRAPASPRTTRPRFAAMAEQLPEPPSLDAPAGPMTPAAPIGVAPRPSRQAVAEAEAAGRRGRGRRRRRAPRLPPRPRPPSRRRPRPRPSRAGRGRRGRGRGRGRGRCVEADDPRIAMLGLSPDFAAAEAEAAMSAATTAEAAERGATEEIPAIADEVVAARLAGLVPPSESRRAERAPTTQVVVTGLVSVASIAGFKRHLGRAPGRRLGRRLVRPRRRVRLQGQPRRRRRPQGRRSPACPASRPASRASGDGFDVTARDPEAHD